MSAIAHQLESIVGSQSVTEWESLEPSFRAQIGAALQPKTQAECLVYPNTQAELAEVMTCAQRDRWRVLVCGSGSKLSWGGLTQVDLLVSTARLDRLIDHAVGDLTVTAEAGICFATLQDLLAQANQFLAIDPLYPQQATLGGIIATANTGALRHRYGGIRDMLLGISMVRADGQLVKAGGRVVKNVAGYDLMKLFTGSYGTLGILSQVTFRVYPKPEAACTVVLLGNIEAIAQATQTLLASALTPTAVTLTSPQLSHALGYKTAIALMVQFQSIAVSVAKQSKQLIQVGEALGLEAISSAIAEGIALHDDDQQQMLWQSLRKSMETADSKPAILGKLGVSSTHAVQVLDKVSHLIPDAVCKIHAGSGLGMIRCSAETPLTTLTALRQLCQTYQGFFTVLEAPIAVKQNLDLWGYTGNALDLMQKLKQQFDPASLLNRHRFVGGI